MWTCVNYLTWVAVSYYKIGEIPTFENCWSWCLNNYLIISNYWTYPVCQDCAMCSVSVVLVFSELYSNFGSYDTYRGSRESCVSGTLIWKWVCEGRLSCRGIWMGRDWPAKEEWGIPGEGLEYAKTLPLKMWIASCAR